MLGTPRCDVAGDLAFGQRLEVRLAGVAGIGRGFLGLAAEILFNLIDERHELILVAHALRQAMRDDDLRRAIDSGLCVEALDVAILGLQDAAFRIGEVALRPDALRDVPAAGSHLPHPPALATAAAAREDTEPAVAGPHPSSNVWRRSGATGGPALQIRGISRTLRQRPMLRPYGADQFSVADSNFGTNPSRR